MNLFSSLFHIHCNHQYSKDICSAGGGSQVLQLPASCFLILPKTESSVVSKACKKMVVGVCLHSVIQWNLVQQGRTCFSG